MTLPVSTIAVAASAVLVPTFAAPYIAKIPGGALGAIGLGVAMIYFGRKMDGLGAAVVLGTGAGLLTGQVVNLVLGNNIRATA